MELEELDQQLNCFACGESFWFQACPEYRLNVERTLCANCAVARGGFYDQVSELWKLGPAVEDIVAEMTV